MDCRAASQCDPRGDATLVHAACWGPVGSTVAEGLLYCLHLAVWFSGDSLCPASVCPSIHLYRGHTNSNTKLEKFEALDREFMCRKFSTTNQSDSVLLLILIKVSGATARWPFTDSAVPSSLLLLFLFLFFSHQLSEAAIRATELKFAQDV